MTPAGRDLLMTARGVILSELVPTLNGDARFKALMVATIRTGDLDPGKPGRDATAATLLALAEAQCRISSPKALNKSG